MIRFDVVTLFPEMLAAVTASGITGRARDAGLWQLAAWNPRDFTSDNYRTVDDRPYGGGPGMVMLAEPLAKALDAVHAAGGGRVLYLSPQGRRLDHGVVARLARERALTLLCGRYEGVDERLLERRVDEELSIGDFVLSGGEIAALSVLDAVVRLLPGALGDHDSAASDSFYEEELLSAPSYTRPPEYRGHGVPEVLRSGDHARIEAWRRAEAERLTRERRPELWRGD